MRQSVLRSQGLSVTPEAIMAAVIIGLMSDTHGRLETTRAALRALHERSAEYLIHSGDICGEEILEQMAGTPGAFVFGNNDFDHVRYRQLAEAVGLTCLDDGGIVTVGGKSIAVAHGDKATVMRQLLARRPDIFIYGHTHVPMDAVDGGVRFINPGALHRAKPKTCATLDTATGQLELIEVE